MTRGRISEVALVALGCWLLTGSAARPEQRESISVDDPRPLAEVIRVFQAQYGWIVTYEDPRYVHETDLVDVTESVRNPAAAPSGRRVVIPRGGPFSFVHERPPANSSVAEIAALMDALVAAYSASGYPGTFKVLRSDNVSHVVPVSVRGRDGNTTQQSSILDVQVSLSPQKDRNTVDALSALLAAIQKTTGQRIVLGTSPINLLVQSRMEEGAEAETAREALMRILRATGKGVSWLLFYDVGHQMYVLNLTIVK